MTRLVSCSVAGEFGLPGREVDRIVRATLSTDPRDVIVSVTFLGLSAMSKMHQAHKHRSGPTDVLAFPLPQPDGSLVGDVYVCPGVAAQAARLHGITRREELIRLIVHGTLHILGFDHPEGVDREKSTMWKRQEALVIALR